MRRFLLLIVFLVLPADFAAAQITGRVVIGGIERSGIVVSLERENGQVLHQTFTNSLGTFQLDAGAARRGAEVNYLYVVIRKEGFKTYRQRVDPMDFRGGGTFAIHLEPEDRAPEAKPPAAPNVDVRQLGAGISDRAVREYQQGLDAARSGKISKAIPHFEQAVKLSPAYYEAWVDLGDSYDRTDRPDAAMAAFLKAADANPRGALAALNVGALHYRQGERERGKGDPLAADSFERGRQWLEKAIALDSSSATARFYLGAALFRLNRLNESEDMLHSALERNGSHAQTRLMLINVYSKQNRFAAALGQATAFLEENPAAPERESILQIRKQLEAALAER